MKVSVYVYIVAISNLFKEPNNTNGHSSTARPPTHDELFGTVLSKPAPLAPPQIVPSMRVLSCEVLQYFSGCLAVRGIVESRMEASLYRFCSSAGNTAAVFTSNAQTDSIASVAPSALCELHDVVYASNV